VPPQARAMPSSLENGTLLNFGGTTTPLLGTTVPAIFAQDLHTFGANQL